MKRHLSFDFKINKAAKGVVTIEGLANANTIDRAKERILPSAWNLENYKKNPVVLFDHGHDPTFGSLPIGRAVAVEARDEGLYTKIEISNSKSEKISAVRDLVEEGILKTFSVGFDPQQTQAADGDIIEITKAELIETSVVPVPMNQDSTFALLSRKKSYWHSPTAKRWYEAFAAKVEAIKKGAFVAAAVNQRLYDLIELGEIRNKDAALKFAADEAGASLAEIKKALGGDLKALTDEMIHAFATVFKLDKHLLHSLNRGDLVLLDRVMTRDDIENQGKDGGEAVKVKKQKAAKGTKSEKEPKDEGKAAEGEKAQQAVVSCITIPKDKAESMEAASKMAADAGYVVDAAEETDVAYVFWQKPKDQVDVDAAYQLDLGDGVTALVAPLKEQTMSDEGKSGEGGTSKAAGEPGSEGTEETEDEDDEEETAELTEEEVTQAKDGYAKFQEERKATNEGGPGNPAAWIADEDKWNKAKEMAKAAGADDVYAFAVWAYLNVLGGTKKSYQGPMGTKGVDVADDNPYLELSRAQIGILGAMLNELKGMSGKLDGLADITVSKAVAAVADEQPAEGGEPGKDGEVAKSLDLLKTYQRDLDVKLKRLNV